MQEEACSSLQLRTTIEAAPERVWSALTDQADRDQWWPGVTLERCPGGQLTELWTDHDGTVRRTQGRVRALEGNAVLVFEWADEGWPAPTVVEILLRRSATSATLVTVRESGWEHLPEGGRLVAEHRAGWRMHLEHLRQYASRAGQPDRAPIDEP